MNVRGSTGPPLEAATDTAGTGRAEAFGFSGNETWVAIQSTSRGAFGPFAQGNVNDPLPCCRSLTKRYPETADRIPASTADEDETEV